MQKTARKWILVFLNSPPKLQQNYLTTYAQSFSENCVFKKKQPTDRVSVMQQKAF